MHERLARWSQRNPLAMGLLVAVVLGATLGFWHLTQLSTELVRSAAYESAEHYSDLLVLINDVYTSEVVERRGTHDVEVTADYIKNPGAIPLPATMLRLLLDRLGDNDSGMRGRQFNEDPKPTMRGLRLV